MGRIRGGGRGWSEAAEAAWDMGPASGVRASDVNADGGDVQDVDGHFRNRRPRRGTGAVRCGVRRGSNGVVNGVRSRRRRSSTRPATGGDRPVGQLDREPRDRRAAGEIVEVFFFLHGRAAGGRDRGSFFFFLHGRAYRYGRRLGCTFTIRGGYTFRCAYTVWGCTQAGLSH